jgi:hypothetical protein
MSGFATNHNGKPELDEHLNLVRDYQVDLHNKLVNSEENRAHMSTYINFEEDALGDNGILGEKDIDYFIDKQDMRCADDKTRRPSNNSPTANGPTENGPPVRPSARLTEHGPPVRPSDRPTENGPPVRPSDRSTAIGPPV